MDVARPTRPTSKQILERLKSSKTPWQSIAELLNEVKHVNLVIPTAGITAYGRFKLWQHAVLLFYQLAEGLRVDSVAISSLVSSCGSRQWSLALWTLGRCPSAPRGLTSAAVACGQRGEWTWSLRLSQEPGLIHGHIQGTSVQCLTASLSACEKASRWSLAVELGRWMRDGRLQADHLAMNGILNACASARQWQRCIVQSSEMVIKDAVMSNIFSNACAGAWAWPKALQVLQDEGQRCGGRSLPGFSAVMQSLQWLTAVDFLKILQVSTVEADAISCGSCLKTLEAAGHWRRCLDSLAQNDQQQLVPDALLYNTLVSSSEKSTAWRASLSLFALRASHFGLDALSASATVLSCCRVSMWPWALDLLKSLERENLPPSSHALAAVLGEVAEVPEVEVMVLSMLPHATVDGVAPPPSLLPTLLSAASGAAAYRHPGVVGVVPGAPLPRLVMSTTSSNRKGLYRYSKELRLLRHLLNCAPSTPSEVCRAIESFGAGTKRWLKVAGTQKAKVLEAVVAGVAVQQPTQILEIGTYCGYSALRMLLALQHCPSAMHIDSLEADAVHAVVACNVLQVAGVSPEQIRIHIGHSKSLLPRWPAAQFAAVFMDQRGSRYEEDLSVLEQRQLLAPGAAIIADNVLKPGAPRFLWKLAGRHRHDHSEYHLQILSLQEFAMPSEDWMSVSLRTASREASESREVPDKILELHHLAEAMRDLASKPGGTSVSFDEWRTFAAKMKEELKRLGLQATAEVEPP